MGAHGVVKHANDEYVRGENYTNTLEGFFSLLKGRLTACTIMSAVDT